MTFALNSYRLPKIRSYAEAFSKWDKTKPWRGDADTNTRPFRKDRKRDLSMRKLDDGSIAFKFHDTDVVVWHPDNSFTVTFYPSVSTGALATALMPGSLYASFSSEPHIIVDRDHAYQIKSPCLFVEEVNGWFPRDYKPFYWRTVDRNKAKQALANEPHVEQFITWAKAITALKGGVLDPSTSRSEYYGGDIDVIINRMRNREAWQDVYNSLAYSFGRWAWDGNLRLYRVDWTAISRKLRDTVYKRHDAFRVEALTHIKPEQLKTYRAQAIKWGEI